MGVKMKVEFDGFDKFIEEFERQEKSLKPAVEKALEETFKAVTPGIKQAIVPHHQTGLTEDSLIKTPKVEWTGNVGEMKVGFSVREGGIASQFLLYGAKASVTGTPYRPPDMKLWNAVFGSAVKKKVADIQKTVFEEELLK